MNDSEGAAKMAYVGKDRFISPDLVSSPSPLVEPLGVLNQIPIQEIELLAGEWDEEEYFST